MVRPWFDDLIAREKQFTVPLTVWTSFLRLATNRRIFPVPTPLADAFAFLDATIGQPHHLRTDAGERHLDLVKRCCEEADAVGDVVPNAVIAALALEYGCEVVTLDWDFARFTSVRRHRPVLPAPHSS